ncbi:MAG: LexA family protein [Pseudobdellovibrio sp.]
MGAFKDSLIMTDSEGFNALVHIPCGFPSPATEYIENNLNLHDLVVKRPAATYFMRASGDSMTGVGIYPDDVLVIDRSIKPRSGQIVVASINNEYTLKIFKILDHKIFLMPANPNYKPIIVNNPDDLQIFGVLTYNLHKHV